MNVMHSLFKEIREFSETKFPTATSLDHMVKLIEEAKEVIDNPDDITEYADCCIALFAAVARQGYNYYHLLNAMEAKMKINESRIWIKQHDGTYRHKKDNDK